jgi:di/tricarboxylate transporter
MIMTEGETNSPVRSYSLPWYAPRLAIIAGATLVILVIATSSLYVYYYSRSSELDKVRVELESARSITGKMDALHRSSFTIVILPAVSLACWEFLCPALHSTKR